MGSALIRDYSRDRLIHLGAADERPRGTLVQKGLERCPFEILILHALPQHVDPLLQHGDDAGIASGFDQFPSEAVLCVGQRNRGLYRHVGHFISRKVIPSSTRVNCGDV